MLTQERLKELLHYNPDTGVFTRRIKTGNAKKGDIVGCVADGYLCAGVDYKVYRLHRLACLFMKGRWPIKDMDHKDHIRSNNRWGNLREVTEQENSRNRSITSRNTSGIVGVSWNKNRGAWQSMIKNNRKQIYLGAFKDKFLAICARKSAENKLGFHLNHGKILKTGEKNV